MDRTLQQTQDRPQGGDERLNPWGILAWSLTVMTWLCGIPAAAYLWGLG